MQDVIARVLPPQFDNKFPGQKSALYLFSALVGLTIWQSLLHIFASQNSAADITVFVAGNHFESAAGAFTLWGIMQLVIALVSVIACLRYRSMIPLLLLFYVFEYTIRFWIASTRSIELVGLTGGNIANVSFIAVGLILFALSIWQPKPPIANPAI